MNSSPGASVFQTRAIGRFDAALARRSHLLDDDALSRATLVVAPHPDDETLGCGGTIARIRATGARVVVVACTDGSRSHRHLMSVDELRRRRAAEFLAACTVLGVAPTDAHLLGHEDGTLESRVDATATVLADLIRTGGIERILIPFRGEGIADHLAARAAGLRARELASRPIEALEYPVWFWHVWPFVRPQVHGVRPRLRAVRDALDARRLSRMLTRAVSLGPALDAKTAALDQHRSQVTRLVDDPRWLTLADVAEGDWLRRCLGPREYFAPC